MKSLALIIVLISFATAYTQDAGSYYVQFKVKKVSSPEDADLINKKIGNKKAIISTHTDHVTSTFFCTMGPEAEYTFDDFEGWFKKLGYEIVCFNKGITGDGRMISPHELKICEENNTE